MSASIDQQLQSLEIPYRVLEVSLDAIFTDKEIKINSPITYITNTPVAVTAKLNKASNDSFKLTTVQIIKVYVKSIFISITETSNDVIEFILSDIDIFSDIGIEDRAVLVNSEGVEYDARNVQQIDAELAAQIALRDTTIDTYNLDVSAYRDVLFAIYSTLDQALTVKYYGSVDGTKYHKIGSDITIADGSGTEQFDIQTISDSWKYMRITVKAGVNPTEGSYTVEYSMKT